MDFLPIFSFTIFLIISSSMASLSSCAASRQAFLAAHNAARLEAGVPPIVWDEKIAKYAKQYAKKRQGDCALRHSFGPYAENIAMGGGLLSPLDAVNMWVEEKNRYDPESNRCVGGECGHYMNVVSKKAKRLGCASVKCADAETFVICNYASSARSTPLPNQPYLPRPTLAPAPTKPTPPTQPYLPRPTPAPAPTKPTLPAQPYLRRPTLAPVPVTTNPTLPTPVPSPTVPAPKPTTPVPSPTNSLSEPDGTGPSPTNPSPADAKAFLDAHNHARAEVGVPLAHWDNVVARYAMAYAKTRIPTCSPQHSTGGSYSENIALGGQLSPQDAVNMWVGEKNNYDSGTNTCRGTDCGHYSNIVARDSVRLGCARVKCANSWIFVVCDYAATYSRDPPPSPGF